MKPTVLAPGRMLAAVIGKPVGHSLSPAMHNSAFGQAGRPWHYFAVEADESTVCGILGAVRELPFGGLSVTTPLKEAVIEHLDDVSPRAMNIRSVNCIVVREGRLSGDSTDGQGCADALGAAGADLPGAAVTLLGAGATARAVASSLCESGAVVTVVNRSRENADRLCREVSATTAGAVIRVASEEDSAVGDAVRSADIVINTTTVGMNSSVGDDPVVDGGWLRAGQIVMDAVYQPLETPLLRAARERGAAVVDGISMLVHQAVRQQVLWFGHGAVERGTMARVMRTAAERELTLRHR